MARWSSSSSSSSLLLSSSHSSQERSILILSTVLFSLSTYYMLKRMAQNRESDRNSKQGRIRRKELTPTQLTAKVSDRCLAALSPAVPYYASFLQCLQDPYHAEDNPNGYIALCMAENKLVIDLLTERLLQPGTATAAFSDPTVYGYNSFLGLPVARQAAAYFLAKRFLFPERHDLTPQEALSHINPSHVAIGSGLANLLHSLFFLLGNGPGESNSHTNSGSGSANNGDGTDAEGSFLSDACLIPAPYYAAFESDMQLVAGITPVAVHMANPQLGPSHKELDLAYMQAKSRGLNPTFVLLTNPHNPLGIIYSPLTLTTAVAWARKRGLHTIVDEIYALSTHQPPGQHGFESIIKVLKNDLQDDVHFVWSISKDFGASGLRVGFVYSQNTVFLEGMSNLNIFSGVSGPIQMVVSELVTDDAFVDRYLQESRMRLQRSYHICTCKLEEMVLPFVPAEAGMFVYVDFTSLLPAPTVEWETKLFDLVVQYAHVVLTPGESQRDRTPGMFRICYAWSEPEVLEVAMERLSRLVAKVRRMEFVDLNETTLRGVL